MKSGFYPFEFRNKETYQLTSVEAALVRLCYAQNGTVRTAQSLIRNSAQEYQLQEEDFEKLKFTRGLEPALS